MPKIRVPAPVLEDEPLAIFFGFAPQRAVLDNATFTQLYRTDEFGRRLDNCWKRHRATRWRREPLIATQPPSPVAAPQSV